MPRTYTVEAENFGVNPVFGDVDLLDFPPIANKPIELFGFEIYSLDELQEAQEEWLRFRIITGHTVASNGGSITPQPVCPGDAAFGVSVVAGGATIASGGTPIQSESFAFNVRRGRSIFLPDGYWADTTRLVVRLLAAPVDIVSLTFTAWFRQHP